MEMQVPGPKVKVQAKRLAIHCKVRDCFGATLYDQDGRQIGDDYDDYVPDFMPGKHYGDYLLLDIDVDTGQITNWKKPSAAELLKTFVKETEEE